MTTLSLNPKKRAKDKFNSFPAIKNRRVLTIGIHKQVFEQCGKISRKRMRILLYHYTHHPEYLKNLAAGGHRYNLDDSIAGEISAADIATAKLKTPR